MKTKMEMKMKMKMEKLKVNILNYLGFTYVFLVSGNEKEALSSQITELRCLVNNILHRLNKKPTTTTATNSTTTSPASSSTSTSSTSTSSTSTSSTSSVSKNVVETGQSSNTSTSTNTKEVVGLPSPPPLTSKKKFKRKSVHVEDMYENSVYTKTPVRLFVYQERERLLRERARMAERHYNLSRMETQEDLLDNLDRFYNSQLVTEFFEEE